MFMIYDNNMYNRSFLHLPGKLIHAVGYHEWVANARAGMNHNWQSVAKVSHVTPPVKELSNNNSY